MDVSKEYKIPLVVDLGKGETSMRGRERVCMLICVFVFLKN